MENISDILGIDCEYDDVYSTEIHLSDSERDTAILNIPIISVKEPRERVVRRSSGAHLVSKKNQRVVDERRNRFLNRMGARWYNKGRYTVSPEYRNIFQHTRNDLIQNASRIDEHLWNLLLCIVEIARFPGEKGKELIGEVSGFHIPTMDHVERITNEMLSDDRIIFEENESGCTLVRICRHGMDDFLSSVTDGEYNQNTMMVILSNGQMRKGKFAGSYIDFFTRKCDNYKEKSISNSHLDKVNFIGGYFKMKFIDL